jgi:hypothetical protein
VPTVWHGASVLQLRVVSRGENQARNDRGIGWKGIKSVMLVVY